MLKKILKICTAFIAGVLVASVIASIFSTQFVVAGLHNVGVEIPISTRLQMTFDDLPILQTLALVIAACFLIGFIVAAIGHKLFAGNRLWWYTVAGGSALLATLLLMDTFLQLMPIAGARTSLGLLTQTIAGAVGGYVYARMSKPNVDQRIVDQRT